MLIQVTNQDVMFSSYLKKDVPIIKDNELGSVEMSVLVLRFNNEDKFDTILTKHLAGEKIDIVKVSNKKPGYRHYQNINIVYYNEELKQIWIDFVLETRLSLHQLRKLKIENILKDD